MTFFETVNMTRNIIRYTSLFLGLLSVACGYDNGDRQRMSPSGSYYDEVDVTLGSIDTDVAMTDVESGVGVFVEYAKGGQWTLRVGCDTAVDDAECFWQIYAYTTVGVPISSVQTIDLESNDILSVKSDGELWLDATATLDLDGVSFVTDPGEPVTFDVYLEGDKHPEDFFYYVSGGEVVAGTRSPVIELTPTEP